MKSRLTTMVGLLLAMTASAAGADTLDSVTLALEQGNNHQALQTIESMSAGSDARSRFLKATALAANGKVAPAIETLKGLIRDYPKLPEPYNNLAALYAKQGKLEQAKDVLEQAIRTDKSYSTVYDNLSAVYVEMARNSYVKALRIEDESKPPRLQLLYAMHVVPKVPVPVKVAEAQLPAATHYDAQTHSTPKAVPAPAPKAAPAPAPKAAPAPAPKAAPAPAPKGEPAPAPKGEPAPAPKAEPTTSSTSAAVATADTEKTPVARDDYVAKGPVAQVELSLQQWAKAWSEQNVEAYLASYTADFDPGTGQSHEEWVKERRTRIKKPKDIRVTLNAFQVKQKAPDRVVVRLWQHYVSGRYQDRTLKRFVLERQGGHWLIASEKNLKVVY